MPKLGLRKKLAGAKKKLKDVKNKTALKLIDELAKKEKEHEDAVKRLKKQRASLGDALEQMQQLVDEFCDYDTLEERQELLERNKDFTKAAVQVMAITKELKNEQKQFARIEKVNGALSKLVSKDAVLQEMGF